MSVDCITVLLADDTLIAREGWKSIIETAADIEVVGEAANPLEVMRLVRELAPDVLLMDLKWAGDKTAGWVAIRELKTIRPGVKVIAVTAYEDLIADARRAGADAAMLKTFSRAELLGLIRELASRKEGLAPAEPETTPLAELSGREREVLALLVEGLSDKEIAGRLSIAENTAKNHVSNILSKLGVKNRTQAAALALKSGLI